MPLLLWDVNVWKPRDSLLHLRNFSNATTLCRQSSILLANRLQALHSNNCGIAIALRLFLAWTVWTHYYGSKPWQISLTDFCSRLRLHSMSCAALEKRSRRLLQLSSQVILT